MSDVAFLVDLGRGLYIDSNGEVYEGAPLSVPVYKAPFEVPIDPKTVKSALTEVNGALKDIDKNNDLLLLFHVWKADTTLLKILANVGKIAGMIAPVFAVAGFALDVAKLLGFIKDGPSALEKLVIERFDDLESRIDAVKRIIEKNDLRDCRVGVENFLSAVRNHVATLDQLNLSPSELWDKYLNLLTTHESHIDRISTIMDKATWETTLDAEKYRFHWKGLQPVLYTETIGGPKQALIPKADELVLDHRLMVPLVSYAAEAYLAAIRGIMPEYRTTGDFRDNLRQYATKLEQLAQAMCEKVLARTIYTPDHFWLTIPQGYVDFSFKTGEFSLSPTCTWWPVGAMDLRLHDDEFFAPFLHSLWKSDALGQPHKTKFAGLNFRWIPPAKLEAFGYGYRITNPEECAAAANAQSEQDYAALLSMSGYPELIRLVTLYRHESTEPDKSQTVRPGKVRLYRNPQALENVTITSPPVHLTGEVITSPAKREPQECLATVRINTQPLNRTLPIRYKIRLRTLHSVLGPNQWYERPYSSHCRGEYEPDPSDPNFKRLVIVNNKLALAEHDLVGEWTTSPRDRVIKDEDSAEMVADTFDWWIPVPPPFKLGTPFEITAAGLKAFGWAGGMKDEDQLPPSDAMQVLSDQNYFAKYDLAHPDLTAVPGLLWKKGAEDWDGQHREIRRKKVTVKYTLRWEGDTLWVSIRNDIPDRNYVVYVVVEEQFLGSPNVLHTAVPIPINGLLTYVPEKFFQDELNAVAKTATIIRDLAGRYIPTVDAIGPSDPIAWIRPGDLVSPISTAALVEHIHQNHPDLVRLYMSENSVAAKPKRRQRTRTITKPRSANSRIKSSVGE